MAENLRQLLCALGTAIRNRVAEGRKSMPTETLATVANQSIADTIYTIDKFGEEAIGDWFGLHWPSSEPVEVVMEGPQETQCFPRGTRVTDTKWKCLLDPIDGTRGIMYDKRSAWALSGIAPSADPQPGSRTFRRGYDRDSYEQTVACRSGELYARRRDHGRGNQCS